MGTFWFLCASGEKDLHLHRVTLRKHSNFFGYRFPSYLRTSRITSGIKYVLISLHISTERYPLASSCRGCQENLPRKRSNFLAYLARQIPFSTWALEDYVGKWVLSDFFAYLESEISICTRSPRLARKPSNSFAYLARQIPFSTWAFED